MTYSKKTLALLGKEVVQRHPELATGILNSFPSPTCTDLEKMSEFFKIYCTEIDVKPESITGPVYKSSITEIKKVFISAMINLYGDRRLFNKILSDILEQEPSATTRMIGEVQFRYKKDQVFIEKVNSIVNKITLLNYLP